MTHSAVPASARLQVFLISCLLAAVLCVFLPPALPTAHAQDENAPAADDAKKADTPAAAPRQSSNIFMHIIRSLSWFLPIMLAVSIALMSLVVLLIMELRMAAAIPPGFVEE